MRKEECRSRFWAEAPALRACGTLFGGLWLAAASAASPLGPVDARLEAVVNRAVLRTTQQSWAEPLRSDEVAVTLVDLSDPRRPIHASHRGDAAIYPASVVKLFYLVAAHQALEDGRLADTAELQRALRDMIVKSYNEATHYVVDLLTGTTSGPELSAADLVVWQDQRNSVNRYFHALGYTNINVNKKPWCEGPYGRETQAIATFTPKRNLLTTDATARLLVEIATGRAVSERRSAEMMSLLRRDPFGTEDDDPGSQAKFTGPALPAGAKLWSKAGWTSETRHDAAYVELPDNGKIVVVVFTVGHANEAGILQHIARELLAGRKELPQPPRR